MFARRGTRRTRPATSDGAFPAGAPQAAPEPRVEEPPDALPPGRRSPAGADGAVHIDRPADPLELAALDAPVDLAPADPFAELAADLAASASAAFCADAGVELHPDPQGGAPCSGTVTLRGPHYDTLVLTVQLNEHTPRFFLDGDPIESPARLRAQLAFLQRESRR